MIAPFRLLTGGSGKADEITVNTMYAMQMQKDRKVDREHCL